MKMNGKKDERPDDRPDDRPYIEKLIAKAKRLHREHDELTMADIAARLGVGIHESTVWKWINDDEEKPRIWRKSELEGIRLENVEGSAIIEE